MSNLELWVMVWRWMCGWGVSLILPTYAMERCIQGYGEDVSTDYLVKWGFVCVVSLIAAMINNGVFC